MRDLARSGIGIVLVTHHVHEIIPEIERVVLMRQGRIAADGPKDEILTERHLSSTFGVDVHLTRHEGYVHVY